jgi:superfamily I DNA/RNA helicase
VNLTQEQRLAVEWGDGPLMVLAGAGTGKTTVIVERVRHLLARDDGLQPENVLVLTYNVKAAAELADRLQEMLGLETASRLWVHNFHSFGHRLLSDNRAELGLAESADVLDHRPAAAAAPVALEVPSLPVPPHGPRRQRRRPLRGRHQPRQGRARHAG